MSKDTITWGPTARKDEPHAFEASTDNPRWCRHCGSIEDAYAHASEQERAAFDQARAIAEAPRGITSSRVALMLHRAMDAWQPGSVLDAPEVTGDIRMPGEFHVRMPSTGQSFRVTVALMAGEDDES